MLRNQYGREIKKGIVFGYLCCGKGGDAHDNKVYRFGRSKKTELDKMIVPSERTMVFIERLGCSFGGLNRPETVVLWEQVADVHKAWDIVKDYLRNMRFAACKTDRPLVVHEAALGDNFFSLGCKCSTEEFEKHLKEAFAKLLNICK